MKSTGMYLFFNNLPKMSCNYLGISCKYPKIPCVFKKPFQALKQNVVKVWLKVQYCSILPFGTLIEICFIFISLDYLNLRTTFLLISLTMLYTNEADFRQDTRWQFTAPWVTPFWHCALALKL